MKDSPELELDDLTYVYEDITSIPQPQKYLASKREFSSLASTKSDPTPEPGQYYKYQQYINRRLQHWDTIFIKWDPGVGKTCGIVAPAEWWHKHVDEGGHIRRCLVVERSGLLVEEVRNQIVCHCTDRLYNQVDESANTERKVKYRIKKNLKVWWTIRTLEKLASELRHLSNEELIEQYSNTMIVLDEVHNLSLDYASNNWNDIRYRIINHVPVPKVVITPGTGEGEATAKKPKLDIVEIYIQISRLVHLPKSTKIVAMTATPMIDKSDEIISVFNLVLPFDKQFTQSVNTMTDEQIMEKFKGRLSVIHQKVSGVNVVREGVPINCQFVFDDKVIKSQFPIYAVEMSAAQKRAYNIARTNPSLLKDNEKSDSFRTLERQVSTFLYPPSTEHPYGQVGEAGYVNMVPKEGISETFRTYLLKYLPEMSPIDDIIVKTMSDRGIEWIFCNYVPAAYSLGLALKVRGVELFNPKTSVFQSEKGSLLSYCGSESEGRRLVDSFSKKLRYVIIDKVTSGEGHRKLIMELINSPENRHGEYVKYIIGTPLSREGINIYNTYRTHYSPYWHRNFTFQGENRGNRGPSGFKALIDERKRLGMDPVVETRIRAYASVYDMKVMTEPFSIRIPGDAEISPDKLGINTGSVDLDMYLTSELKDIRIKRIDNLMDRAADDCAIQYDKNISRDSKDGSPECNYRKCEYICMDFDSPITPEIRATFGKDTSSFLNLYSGEVSSEIQTIIQTIFRKIQEIKMDSLESSIPQYEPRFIKVALMEMVDKRIPVLNSFGFTNYLYVEGDRVFAANSFDEHTKLPIGYYSKGMIATGKSSIENYISRVDMPNQDKIQAEFMLSTNYDVSKELLIKLSNSKRVELFEQALVQYITTRTTSSYWQNFIINLYQKYLYQFNEPIIEMEKYKTFMSKRNIARGHPVSDKNVLRVEHFYKKDFDEFTRQTDTEIIFVHTLQQRLNETKKTNRYATTAKFSHNEMNLRVFKPSEGTAVFRNPTNLERPAYAVLIQLSLSNIIGSYKERYGVFGLILQPDQVFRIVDRYGGEESVDKRENIRGHSCTTMDVSRFAEILWNLRFLPLELSNMVVPSLPEMRTFLSAQRGSRKPIIGAGEMSDEKIEYLYRWFSKKGYTRTVMCNLVKEHLISKNQVYIE